MTRQGVRIVASSKSTSGSVGSKEVPEPEPDPELGPPSGPVAPGPAGPFSSLGNPPTYTGRWRNRRSWHRCGPDDPAARGSADGVPGERHREQEADEVRHYAGREEECAGGDKEAAVDEFVGREFRRRRPLL